MFFPHFIQTQDYTPSLFCFLDGSNNSFLDATPNNEAIKSNNKSKWRHKLVSRICLKMHSFPICQRHKKIYAQCSHSYNGGSLTWMGHLSNQLIKVLGVFYNPSQNGCCFCEDNWWHSLIEWKGPEIFSCPQSVFNGVWL